MELLETINTKQKYAHVTYDAFKRQCSRLEEVAVQQGGNRGRLALFASLGKRSLFFMLTKILGREDLDHPWLFARCLEVQANPNGHLDLWAREHGKSSIITFGQTIRDIICNAEITVGIFSHTRPVAKDFLGQIKFEMEQNTLLKDCYPDVLWKNPKKQAPVWSLDKGIVVKRNQNPKEATVEAWGLVDGQPTGKHFSLLVYDDVVTRESVSTPEMITKVTDAWALSLNLGARGGQQRYIGTRYHHNDTYKVMLERGAAIGRIHPATHNGIADGPPVLLSKEALQEKRKAMGAHVFGCQMLLNPHADVARGFQEKWLRYWQPPISMQPSAYSMVERGETPVLGNGAAAPLFNKYIVVDPAGARKRNSDYTVMLVIGLGHDKNWYVIDGIRDRLNLKGRAEMLFMLHRRHSPLAVGYEQYGMQADIEYIETEQEARNYRFGITALGGNVAKNDRILSLGPYFEQGRIYLPTRLPFITCEGKWDDLTRCFIEEYLAFPVTSHDDMLDCFARIVEPKLGAEFPLYMEPCTGPSVAVTDYALFS